DLRAISKLSDTGIAGGEKHASDPYVFRAKGLAEYRAGNHEAAVKWLTRLPPKAGGGREDATTFAVLAMAHHGLGQEAPAGQALAAAWAIAAMRMPDLAKGGRFDQNWHGWMRYRILSREAASTLQKAKDGTALAEAHRYHGVFFSRQG